MKKTILLFYIIQAFMGSESKSQTDFKLGYVITNKMDTLHGLIDYRGEIRNSKMCVFKPNQDVGPITFLPGEIHSYQFIDSKYYISKTIDNEPFFLEYLVNGLVNLYFLKTAIANNYYLEKDGDIYKLTNEEREIFIEGKGTYLSNSNKYIGIMKATFADCMEIQPQLNNAQLNHKSLTELTVNYHNMVCNDRACIVYQKPEPIYKVRFTPIAGIEIAKLIYSPVDFNWAVQPQIGIVIKNSMPRINEKLSFNIEASISKPNFIGYYKTTDSYVTYHYDFHLKSYSIKVNGALSYEYPKGKIRPTAAFGAGFIYLGNQTFDVIQDTETPTEVFTEQYSIDAYNPFYFGPNAAIGCNYYWNEKHIFFGSFSYNIFSVYKAFNFNIGYYL